MKGCYWIKAVLLQPISTMKEILHILSWSSLPNNTAMKLPMMVLCLLFSAHDLLPPNHSLEATGVAARFAHENA